MAITPVEKFQSLLRELFEFDVADLDFGIYRIMNHKRQVIERFIAEDLPQAVAKELQQGALAEQTQAAKDLEAARKKVLEALGEEALDADGNLAEAYRAAKAGKEYLDAQERAKSAKSHEALEAAVYNHLYALFSRYYQDGDFISRRRYSKKERYAIHYNGEEVYLYWANHDQYYVKSGEYFTDYTWKAPNGVTVHFKLQAADVEQNNVKGEKRFFLPRLDELAWDEETAVLTIPFEFRPLTPPETKVYGQKNQQEAIIAQAVSVIPKKLGKHPRALAALSAEKRRTDKGESVTYLEHHLRQYTRRNTSDFFIHKDLRGFLSRELDFYLKHEVLNLEELEAAGENLAEGWFQLLRLIKKVGGHIIEFLAQIEDFQKALWEKKKFVTETFYCITVGHIPEAFYPEIAACEAQWEEWKRLFAIDELPRDLLSGDLSTPEGRVAFLKAHPTLVLDTRHFPPDFTDRLLASFDNLDELTDGLLVHAENWQALNLLQEKYRERVKCIYIDPPYNTGSDEFVYKDAYQHSSWLAMMDNRVNLSCSLLNDDGVNLISIDDNEHTKLTQLLETIFGVENKIATIIWHNSSRSSGKQISTVTEYIELFAKHLAFLNEWQVPRADVIEVAREIAALWKKGRKEEARRKLDEFAKNQVEEDPDSNAYLKNYTNIDENSGRVYYAVDLSGDGPGERRYFKDRNIWLNPPPGRHWMSQEYINSLYEQGRIIWRGERPYKAVFLDEAMENPQNIIRIPTRAGRHELRHTFGKDLFTNPKPSSLIKRLCAISGGEDLLCLDYFAGSGTTGHAVINLNREDGGRRKFILVEMAHYFDTVLLPRLKKVTFTPEWKDGKPKRMATAEEAARSPRIVKVIRLESYEDALNNITFDESSGQQALELFKEEYLLQYMLRWETRKSETLLNVEKLSKPFSYRLHIHQGGETRAQAVDLPETFNYLIGLNVETRQVLNDNGRRYLVYRGTTREGRKTVVIWRENEGWTEQDYVRDRDFVAARNLTEGADEVFVNGDSFIPGARALDGVFKARMFAGVEG